MVGGRGTGVDVSRKQQQVGGGLTRRSVVSVTDRQTDRQVRSNAATTAYCTDTAYNTQYCTHSTQ